MGVDFFPCDYCGESICDVGDYERCDCGRAWCDRKCAEFDGQDREEDNCAYCRNEKAEDCDILKYLLNKYNLNRGDVEKECLLKRIEHEHKRKKSGNKETN